MPKATSIADDTSYSSHRLITPLPSDKSIKASEPPAAHSTTVSSLRKSDYNTLLLLTWASQTPNLESLNTSADCNLLSCIRLYFYYETYFCCQYCCYIYCCSTTQYFTVYSLCSGYLLSCVLFVLGIYCPVCLLFCSMYLLSCTC